MQLGSDLSFERLLIVGDTHADTSWLRDVVLPSAVELGVSGIVVVGDFGYWPEADGFLRVAREALSTHGVTVLFLDGNHEHHHLLRSDVEEFGWSLEDSREPVWLGGGLVYLPRGSRIRVGEADVVAFGGAASINKAGMVPGEEWFPEELLSDLDIAFASPAAVMLSHDAPSGWAIPRIAPHWGMSREWLDELGQCEDGRDRLREAFAVVKPRLLLHGHYHSSYHVEIGEEWGKVEVVGLNRNTRRGWGAVLEFRDGEPAIERGSDLLFDTRPWALR